SYFFMTTLRTSIPIFFPYTTLFRSNARICLEGTRLQTAPVKKPEDREILDLVDVACKSRGPGRVSVRFPRAIDARTDITRGHSQQPIPKMLSRNESGLSHSQPLRSSLQGVGQARASRTEDLCPLA